MVSTTYTVAGMTSSDDGRVVRDKVSAVEGIGGVAVEIVPDGDSYLILKHKEDVTPNRSAIDAALREAGNYSLT